MGTCLQCGIEIRLGALCGAHAEALATSNDLTAEQIVARRVPEPAAWLIDQWGNVHPLSSRALVGRVQEECSIAILHHSVSAVHAQIEHGPGEGDAWRLTDRGSLNGTFLEDDPVRSAPLRDRDRIRFGNVSFYFSARVLATAGKQVAGGHTVPTKSRDVAFQARVKGPDGNDMALVQRAAGGIARIDDDTALEFARLEFALLKILAERRISHADPELAFVSSQELAEALDFRSQEADGENVRELVRRVRRKFKAEGIEDLIESRQGVGYRLAWTVRS